MMLSVFCFSTEKTQVQPNYFPGLPRVLDGDFTLIFRNTTGPSSHNVLYYAPALGAPSLSTQEFLLLSEFLPSRSLEHGCQRDSGSQSGWRPHSLISYPPAPAWRQQGSGFLLTEGPGVAGSLGIVGWRGWRGGQRGGERRLGGKE